MGVVKLGAKSESFDKKMQTKSNLVLKLFLDALASLERIVRVTR